MWCCDVSLCHSIGRLHNDNSFDQLWLILFYCVINCRWAEHSWAAANSLHWLLCHSNLPSHVRTVHQFSWESIKLVPLVDLSTIFEISFITALQTHSITTIPWITSCADRWCLLTFFSSAVMCCFVHVNYCRFSRYFCSMLHETNVIFLHS